MASHKTTEPPYDEDKAGEPVSETEVGTEPAGGPAGGLESWPESGDETPEIDIAAEVVELQAAEIAELKNKVLSTLADMENLRRRTEREMSDARKYAVANFAREILSVSDNLHRAIDAVPQEARSGKDISALIEGVEVTERALDQAMKKFGVKIIEAKGQKFDPNLHQAMMEVEDATATPGSVAQEIQVGYMIGERVLRPAFVSVVKKVRPTPIKVVRADTASAGETSEETASEA